LHCRFSVVNQMLHEHAAAILAAEQSNWGRCLSKCAKDYERYQDQK
jgi:hypothetical protein